MKVSDAIKYLGEYSPDDEIIIEWWAKGLFASVFADAGIDLPDEVWSEAVDRYEGYEYNPAEQVFLTIHDTIDDILNYGPEGE